MPSLRVLPGQVWVHRLAPGAAVPEPSGDGFHAVSRTPSETTVACAAGDLAGSQRRAGPYRVLLTTGTIELATSGAIAAVALPLAEAGISIFAMSTFSAACALVPTDRMDEAAAALSLAGFDVHL